MWWAGLLALPLAAASPLTIELRHGHPGSGSALSATPLAHIEFNASTGTASLDSYLPPAGLDAAQDVVRVGFTDANSDSWHCVATSATSFARHLRKQFTLHLDESGNVYHVGFKTRVAKPADGQRPEAEAQVDVEVRTRGPQPTLNKPVVLNADGKLDAKEPEKTFLQKCVSRGRRVR